MDLICFILLLITTVTNGLIIPTKDTNETLIKATLTSPCHNLLIEKIEKYVEDLKNVGISSKNLTAEPSDLNDYSLHIDLPFQKVNWDYSNIKLYGLKYFLFTKFKLFENLKYEYSIYWPYVRDERNYYANGTAMETINNWIPIFGNGTFNNVYVGLNLEGTGRIVIDGDYLQMRNVSAFISAKKCNMKTTGYLGNDEMNDEANKAINRDCPAVLIVMRDLLRNTLSPVISTIYNKSLRNNKIKDIVTDYRKCEKDFNDMLVLL